MYLKRETYKCTFKKRLNFVNVHVQKSERRMYAAENSCTYECAYTYLASSGTYICDALRDLVPFVQFKKREKHPWWAATFCKIAGFSLQLY